jgi:NodT family efflux transporter outer membrane factor (OMF) lipoprotein
MGRAVRRSPVLFVLAVAVGGSSVAGGCAVGPDFKTPVAPAPTSWTISGDPRLATQAATDTLWWKSFGDATLDRLVDLACKQNLPLQVSGLRIVEARAQLGYATGKQFPQVQELYASGTAARPSQNTPLSAILPPHYVDYRAGFDAAWELDFWGKYRRGVETEAAALGASIADYYAALVSLTAEVAHTYVTFRTFEVLVELARTNAKLQEKALEIAQSRFKNGATTELDPTQATTLLETTRATIPKLEIGRQQTRNALGTLLGQPAGTVEELLVGPKEIPKAPPKVAVGLPAEMLRRRPDVRGAELAAAAQCARIGMAKADLYPSFTLFGDIGLETAHTGGGPRNFFSTSSIFYSLGPRINWPFFNYGRIENKARVEDARFQQSLVGYRNVVLKAAQEVEDAMSGFVNSQDASAFEESAVKSAQRAVELAMTQYYEGATDYQRVVDAERSLLERQNTLAQTSSDVATNLIALYKALGGGWESRQDQPLMPASTEQEMRERTRWGNMLAPAARGTGSSVSVGTH